MVADDVLICETQITHRSRSDGSVGKELVLSDAISGKTYEMPSPYVDPVRWVAESHRCPPT